MFVGFVQEPYGAPCTRIRVPDTPSLSLHSSPSSVLGSLGSCSPSTPSSPASQPEGGAPTGAEGKQEGPSNQSAPGPEDEASRPLSPALSPAGSPTSEGDPEPSEDVTEVEEESSCRNNNKDAETKERLRYRQRRGDGELTAQKTPAGPEPHVGLQMHERRPLVWSSTAAGYSSLGLLYVFLWLVGHVHIMQPHREAKAAASLPIMQHIRTYQPFRRLEWRHVTPEIGVSSLYIELDVLKVHELKPAVSGAVSQLHFCYFIPLMGFFGCST